MNMFIDPTDPLEPLAQLFQSLGQPARLRILMALDGDEACVCHLEALLGERQAYISQQLKFLKEAGLVDFRREHRNVYYHLVDRTVLDSMTSMAKKMGVVLPPKPAATPVQGCPCPKCNPGVKNCPPGNQ
jgi:ArsR family transcriptional regulator